jgi:hypothetical protein
MLSADISGFTALSERLAGTRTAWYGGEVHEFGGDAIVVGLDAYDDSTNSYVARSACDRAMTTDREIENGAADAGRRLRRCDTVAVTNAAWETDPMTGLPLHALDYAPDVAVYDVMTAGGAPAWFDELDLRPAPPFQHVGTHATGPETWLLADAARDMELALRSRLIDEQGDIVVGALPGTDDASAETLDAVLDWLADHGLAHPPPDPDEHPLVAAGRLVQEDLCLMVHRDGAWHLDAGVLCFPTLWQLHDRLGLPMPMVHERVAHYDEISDRVDRFFDRLPVGRVVWRRNFSVKPYPHLYVPTVKTEMGRGAHAVDVDGAPYWIRTERQTLRRLPRSGAIVFAIKIQTTRAGVLRHRPDIAAAMAEHFRSWDAPQREYKFAGSDLFVAFVDWLDAVAAGGHSSPEEPSTST